MRRVKIHNRRKVEIESGRFEFGCDDARPECLPDLHGGDADAAGGSVHQERLARLQVRAVNGAIEYAGDLVRSGRYQFVTHSGDIRLMLAGNTGFEVQANSYSGNVHSDFAINRAGAGEGRGVVNTRAIRGAFGDGSAIIVLRAFSGNISISRK